MPKEFAVHLSNSYLFTFDENRSYLSKEQFFDKMEKSNYALIKPHEIRKKYTEFVL